MRNFQPYPLGTAQSPKKMFVILTLLILSSFSLAAMDLQANFKNANAIESHLPTVLVSICNDYLNGPKDNFAQKFEKLRELIRENLQESLKDFLKDQPLKNQLLIATDETGYTPLLYAVDQRCNEAVRGLLELNVNLDARTISGENWEDLIKRGEIDDPSRRWQQLRHIINAHRVKKDAQDLAKIKEKDELLRKEAADAYAKALILRQAITENNKETAEFNLNEHTVNMQFPDGNTPLIEAAQKGRTGLVNLLLVFDAQVTAPDNNYNNALRWATMNGHADTVETLVAHMKSGDICASLRGKNCYDIAKENYERTNENKYKKIMQTLAAYQSNN